MTPRSGTAWRKAWPRASSPTSTATERRSARRRPRAERLVPFLLTAALWGGAACAYLNTFYNAQQAYQEGVRLRAGSGDSLSAPARAAFERAAEKSAVVLERHADSGYADDALMLMGRSFSQLGRHANARAAFRNLVDRFPGSDLAPQARLELVRSERLLGDYHAARGALGNLLEDPAGVDSAEILYERGLIELGLGDHEAAIGSLRELLREHPEFARERQVALRFADTELAAGEYDAALEAYGAYRTESSDPVQRERITLKVARALSNAGREAEASAAYEDLLAASLPDSVRAMVHVERGEMLAAGARWDAAEVDFRRAAELDPGSGTASRATLGRAHITWQERGRREPALEILLDAFLHAPLSVWGDSARTEARALARILHYQRIVDGSEVVAGLDDPALIRSTALYRLAEEVEDVEGDAAAAEAIFLRIADEFPGTPWAPGALLASGLLARRRGAVAEGDERLARLVAWRPDHPAADSARRALGVPIPDRPPAFYDEPETLVALARALPPAKDPMTTIVDQMNRYAERPGAIGAATRPDARPAADRETPPEQIPPDPRPPSGAMP